MTKREICERLIKIYALAGDGLNAELVVCDAIRGLLLDLAAPEKELHPDDEPNLTYAFKDMLRRHIRTQGDTRTICDYCQMAGHCDSSVHEVCLNLQKENNK